MHRYFTLFPTGKVKAAFEMIVSNKSEQRYNPIFQCTEGTCIEITRVEPLFPIEIWNHFLSGTEKDAIRAASQIEDFNRKNNGNL